MRKRRAGEGTVDQLPSGRHRVRIPMADGTRPSIGTFDTEEEAHAIREGMLAKLATGNVAAVGGVTLRAWGAKWFAEREIAGDVRAIRTEISRWNTHVVAAYFVDWPLASITPRDVAEWVTELRKKVVATPHMGTRERKKISRKTIKEVVSILKLALDSAVSPGGLIRENPAASIKIKREARTEDPWTYLEPDEQRRTKESDAIPEPDRLIILYALLTGVREGEQFNQELRDVRLDDDSPHIIVRFGSKGKPPKNGRIRRVYLSAEAVDVCRRWLAVLPTYVRKNPQRLLFPGPRGGRVSAGKTALHRSEMIDLPSGKRKQRKIFLFPRYMRAIGITRCVRWHDLRHSCASSLVAGWWGRRWSLEEVKEHLGHSDISVTQRYAHLSESAIKAAAKGTGGIGGSGAGGGAGQVTAVAANEVTQRSHEPQTIDIAQDPQELLTRRSRVRVPVDPPRWNHSGFGAGGGVGEEGWRDLRRDLRDAAVAFVRGAATERAGELAAALSTEVLAWAAWLPSAAVRLALDLRDGDPLWGPKAAQLAVLALDAAADGADASTSPEAAGGGS